MILKNLLIFLEYFLYKVKEEIEMTVKKFLTKGN